LIAGELNDTGDDMLTSAAHFTTAASAADNEDVNRGMF